MGKITGRTVKKVKRHKRSFPKKTNDEIGKMLNPSLSGTSVGKILSGEYDHLLSVDRVGKVKHLCHYNEEDIIKADALIRRNPRVPIGEIANMENCTVSRGVLYDISAGRYDHIIETAILRGKQMEIKEVEDDNMWSILDIAHDCGVSKSTANRWVKAVYPHISNGTKKTMLNKRQYEKVVKYGKGIAKENTLQSIADEYGISKSTVRRRVEDTMPEVFTGNKTVLTDSQACEIRNVIEEKYESLQTVEKAKEGNRVHCLKCGSKDIDLVDIMSMGGKTAKLKCEKCGQVMYLSTANWSKDGKRYERKMW